MPVVTRAIHSYTPGEIPAAANLNAMAQGRTAYGSPDSLASGVTTAETTVLSWSQVNNAGRILTGLVSLTAACAVATDTFIVRLYEAGTLIGYGYFGSQSNGQPATCTFHRTFNAATGSQTYSVTLQRSAGSSSADVVGCWVTMLDEGV